jgi:methylisocitrate lyase
MSTASQQVTTFRQLHERGCFVIPNPWDAGSARILESLGFKALATTSSGFAWTLGKRDNRVTLFEAIEHLREISGAVRIPVNADFEDGFASEPANVAQHVRMALGSGIAGLSIEDSTRDGAEPLYAFEHAVERVRAAREAINVAGSGVVLTARSEGFIVGRPDLDETIRRLVAFSEAGADCLYAPGIRDLSQIGQVVRAVAPKPVNVLVSSSFATVEQLAALGVRRISVGGALARAALASFVRAAEEILATGTFTSLDGAIPGDVIEAHFKKTLA